MDIDKIYPLIVPSGYYNKNVWDLPHHLFPNTNYILIWVFFGSERTMTYITKEVFAVLNHEHNNWQQRSFENLRNSLTEEENFYSRYRESEFDHSLSFLIFSNNDGIGSSRILFSHELEKAFPKGYMVGMPDRSCGLVISKAMNPADRNILEEIIDEYHGCSGTAMTKSIMPPNDFALPKDWIHPIDNELSAWMIEGILNFNR